jgi:malonyl-CoA/methylmalonyl-CoA synthetase
MLTHDNLASNALVLKDYWRFTDKDVLIHALPIYHTHGLFVATNIVLLAGASMIFLPKFDAGEVIRLMPEATSLMGVPTFYVRLAQDERLTRATAAHMRLFISGSAPLLAEAHQRFESLTGSRILERYGMTETGMITSNPYDGERIAGTVGYPLPGVAVRVRGDDGNLAAPGQPGVLEVRGPNVFAGYWRNPEKTAQEFRVDGYFITGDVATQGEDGRITLVGRAKDLIIAGGLNIYPKEIEEAIDALPGVAESAVIGVPHADLGEGVVAVVARAPGAGLSEASVMAGIVDGLARFKHPRAVIIVDELPRNAMGKVQKAALRAEHAAIFA